LQYLIIARCYGFSSKTLGKIVNPNLIHLRLYENNRKYRHISDETISEIVAICPNLIHIYISYSNQITDISLIEIAKKCQRIEYINIGGYKISDKSLREIANSCPKLQYHHLPDCCYISDSGIIEIISSHPHLLSLSFEGGGLEGCEITNLSIKKIAELCPKLQYFNVSERDDITDESICILLQLCPNLQELILEQCNITDATINAIINLRHNLQKLNIIYCDQVSRNAISSIKSFNPEIKLRSTKLLVIRD